MAEQNPSTSAAESLRRLALAALDGSETAFAEIHRRLGGGIQRFFARRGVTAAEAVTELAQQTWVEAWRGLRERRYAPEKAAFSTYVFAIAQHVLFHHRRNSRGPSGAADDPDRFSELVTPGAEPARALGALELLDALRACLRATDQPLGLLDTEREVLMGLTGGVSERALADRLGVAASTVHARKIAALEKLRRCLAAKGFAADDIERNGALWE